MPTEGHVDLLIAFSRLVSETETPEEILPLLVDQAVSHLGAGGAAVLRVTESGVLTVAALRNLPGGLAGTSYEPETIGQDLAERLLASADGFRRVESLPLVSSGDLYGVLALFFGHEGFDPSVLRLAQGMIDLAAIGLRKAFQVAALRRTLGELHASRETIARNERLRLIGQMAAGVSHDLKNLLSPLEMFTELLRRNITKNPERVEQLLDQMKGTLRTGRQVVERLRLFSRQPTAAKRELHSLNELVREAVDLCAFRVRNVAERVEIKLEPGEPSEVVVETSELVTSIVNIIVNALEVTPSGGEVIVRTGRDGATAWVSVTDAGPGLPDEVRERLFQPFVTTKGDEGTGLGLSMAHQFAVRHGGAITVDSGASGTSFKIVLPVAESPR